jgi:protein DGCR14
MPPSSEASSSSSALVPISSATALAKSTLRQKILSEEVYTSTLSNLIRRDFFPHLERLEAENAYLDALTHSEEPGGEERLERAVRRLVGHEVRAGIVPPTPRPGDTVRSRRREETPKLTPRDTYFDDTPRVDKDNRGEWDPTPLRSQEQDEVDLNTLEDVAAEGPSLDGLTLSSFQSQYTSEDNASFLDILKANEKKRKEVYKWAYEAEQKANDKRLQSLNASRLEAKAGFQASLGKAPEDVKRRIEAGQHPKMITSNGELGSSALYEDTKEDLPLVGVAEISPATGEAKSLQSWPHRARNAFFYGPDVDRSTVSQRTSSLPLSRGSAALSSSLFDDEVSQDKAPGINFNNTRLPDDDEGDDASRGSQTPRSSRIDAAIGGWADTASVADTNNSDTGARSSSGIPSSPRIAGYSFVSPLPSPKPGDLGEERVRQLMTWGTVNSIRAIGQGTANDQDDHYEGSFRIPQTPSRDLLARRLADKSGSRNHKRLQAADVKDTKNKRRSRIDLSPAAQSLLDRTSRGSTGFTSLGSSLLASRDRREDTNRRLRSERWTPSPSPKR